jgi:hypothetical protein
VFFEESITSAFVLSYRVSSTQQSAFLSAFGPAINISNHVIETFIAAKCVSYYKCQTKLSTFNEPYNQCKTFYKPHLIYISQCAAFNGANKQ